MGESGDLDGCLVYDIDFSGVRAAFEAGNFTTPDPTWPTTQCTDWEYDFARVGGYPSIVSEVGHR